VKRSAFLTLILVVAFAFHAFPNSEAEVEAAITNAIKGYLIQKEPAFTDSKIEITYKYSWKAFNTLSKTKGRIKYEVAELYPGFKPLGNIIVPIQVIIDDMPKDKIFLRTNVAVLKGVVVANRSIKKKEVITENDVSVQQRDVAIIYTQNYFKSSEEVIGKEVKAYVPRNYVVIDWMIKEGPLIRAKEAVRITTVVGGVVVSAEGEALEDGVKGAKIKVKNIASDSVIMGTVTGSGEVIVEAL